MCGCCLLFQLSLVLVCFSSEALRTAHTAGCHAWVFFLRAMWRLRALTVWRVSRVSQVAQEQAGLVCLPALCH